MIDFDKYEACRNAGANLDEVHEMAVDDGLERGDRALVLRKVFGICLAEAKRIAYKLDPVPESLEAHQGRLIAAVRKALRWWDNQ